MNKVQVSRGVQSRVLRFCQNVYAMQAAAATSMQDYALRMGQTGLKPVFVQLCLTFTLSILDKQLVTIEYLSG